MGVKRLFLDRLSPGRKEPPLTQQRANRVAPALSSRWEQELGVGQAWTPLSYGEYYLRSASVFAAIRIRQDAVVRAPLRVFRRADARRSGESAGPDSLHRLASDGEARGHAEAAGPENPVQRLLDAPNPFWTRGNLWRATETDLGLWGSAYWGLERNDRGEVFEIWPLRSDRMRVVPDPDRYIKGFVYVGQGRQLIPYVPDDIVWIHYFNPLDEFSGLSPIAPLRLSADMGLDALRANRNSVANESTPGVFIETGDTPTDEEVKEFYERWELRFRGPANVRRPVLLSGGMKAGNLGFSPKDMEYLQTMRWSLEDVARVYGVPKPMMGDLERSTFSNFETSRRVFWEDTMVPQLVFYQEALGQMLLPNLGFDTSGTFVEFDISVIEALQESENDKAKRRQTYVSTGIMTINEVRRELNLPPVEWGDVRA